MVASLQQHYRVESANMMSTRRGYGIKDTVVVHPKTGRVFTLFFFQKKRREIDNVSRGHAQ